MSELTVGAIIQTAGMKGVQALQTILNGSWWLGVLQDGSA